MPTVPVVNKTGDIERKYMAVAIDISDEGAQQPEYHVIGYKITSSAIELNPDVENGTDIRGVNFASMNKFEPSQTFEPHRLTGGKDGVLGARLIHMFRYRDMAGFSKFKCLHIWGMFGAEGAYEADSYDECTISVTSIGGEAWTDVPFTVTYGGNIKHGTVDKLINTVTFTPAA